MLLEQPGGHRKHTAGHGDVLADEDDALVARELLVERLPEGVRNSISGMRSTTNIPSPCQAVLNVYRMPRVRSRHPVGPRTEKEPAGGGRRAPACGPSASSTGSACVSWRGGWGSRRARSRRSRPALTAVGEHAVRDRQRARDVARRALQRRAESRGRRRRVAPRRSTPTGTAERGQHPTERASSGPAAARRSSSRRASAGSASPAPGPVRGLPPVVYDIGRLVEPGRPVDPPLGP